MVLTTVLLPRTVCCNTDKLLVVKTFVAPSPGPGHFSVAQWAVTPSAYTPQEIGGSARPGQVERSLFHLGLRSLSSTSGRSFPLVHTWTSSPSNCVTLGNLVTTLNLSFLIYNWSYLPAAGKTRWKNVTVIIPAMYRPSTCARHYAKHFMYILLLVLITITCWGSVSGVQHWW